MKENSERTLYSFNVWVNLNAHGNNDKSLVNWQFDDMIISFYQ